MSKDQVSQPTAPSQPSGSAGTPKFTAGPWEIDEEESDDPGIRSGTFWIATIHRFIPGSDFMANALLISKAPEMYQALRELSDLYIVNQNYPVLSAKIRAVLSSIEGGH